MVYVYVLYSRLPGGNDTREHHLARLLPSSIGVCKMVNDLLRDSFYTCHWVHGDASIWSRIGWLKSWEFSVFNTKVNWFSTMVLPRLQGQPLRRSSKRRSLKRCRFGETNVWKCEETDWTSPILKAIYRTNDDEAVETWEDLPFSSCLEKNTVESCASRSPVVMPGGGVLPQTARLTSYGQTEGPNGWCFFIGRWWLFKRLWISKWWSFFGLHTW